MTNKLDDIKLCTIEYNNYNSFPRLYNNVHALQFGATGVAAKTGSKIVGALATVATSNNDNMPRLTHRVEPAPATREIGVLKPKVAANIKGALGSMVGATADEYIRSGYVPTKLFSLVNVVQALVRNHNFSKKDDAESQLLSQDVWAMPRSDDTDMQTVKSIHRFPYLVFKDNPLLIDDQDVNIKLKSDTVSSMEDFQKSIEKEIQNVKDNSEAQLKKLKDYVDNTIIRVKNNENFLSRNDYLSITILFTNYREYKRNKEAIEKIKTKMRNIIEKYKSAKKKAMEKITELKKTLDELVRSGSNQQAGGSDQQDEKKPVADSEAAAEKAAAKKAAADTYKYFNSKLNQIVLYGDNFKQFQENLNDLNKNFQEKLNNFDQSEQLKKLEQYINLSIFLKKIESIKLPSDDENNEYSFDKLDNNLQLKYFDNMKTINLLDEKEIITSDEKKFYNQSISYTLPKSFKNQQGKNTPESFKNQQGENTPESENDVIDIVLKIDPADLIEPVLVMSEYSDKNKTIKMNSETQTLPVNDLYETAFKAWARSAPYKLGLLSIIRDESEEDQQKKFSKRIDYLWEQYHNAINDQEINCEQGNSDTWKKVCCKALIVFKQKVEANKKNKPEKEVSEEEKEVSEKEVVEREAESEAAANEEEEQNKQSEKQMAEAEKNKNKDDVAKAYEGILQKDISQWLDRMYFGSRRSGNFTEKSAIMIDSSSEGKGEKGNKGDGIYEYPLYIAGTDGYESGWVYFNKNDANEIKLRLLSLFAGKPEDVDKFLTDVTGLENPLSLRVQHIDLRNEAIKSGKKLKIDLEKFDSYRQAVSEVSAINRSDQSRGLSGGSAVKKGGLAGRTQNKRIHEIGRVKTLKKEKKKKKKKKEKKEKKLKKKKA